MFATQFKRSRETFVPANTYSEVDGTPFLVSGCARLVLVTLAIQ